MNSCKDCSCIENYNDQSKFCGKVVTHGDKESTVFGCEDDCCKDCPYRNKKVVQKNSKPLTKREFLKFLKRQRAKNTIEGILPPIALEEPIPNPVEVAHNNANANHDNVTESQIPFRKEDCTQEKGYQWNNENLLCEQLTVTFYSQEGKNGSHFELKKGNYDESDIKDFEFQPAFMEIPMGLRVKIWNKPGFVGPSSGYLGNNT